jgi:BirA family transcriptional regulator, biotin operon repressor / biotin---[acetyl-CoA-carboxylase] ligase
MSKQLPDLGTRLIGRHLRWHESLPSTNDLALRLTEIPVPEGTVVLADEQTAGRGRMGRRWVSPRGGIWLSVILRPRLPADQVAVIGLVTAAAAAGAVRRVTGLSARVKWPNDVLVDGKKTAGILAEAAPSPGWIVVGIGINANIPADALPPDTVHPATSLEAALGHAVDRKALIREMLRELERGYDLLKSRGAHAALRRWREMADTLGRQVRVETPGGILEGIAQDIDETGALLVRTEGGRVRKVLAGDLRVRTAVP